MLPTEDLFVDMYALVDDAIREGSVAIPRRPGPVSACCDTELLAIAPARHYTPPAPLPLTMDSRCGALLASRTHIGTLRAGIRPTSWRVPR